MRWRGGGRGSARSGGGAAEPRAAGACAAPGGARGAGRRSLPASVHSSAARRPHRSLRAAASGEPGSSRPSHPRASSRRAPPLAVARAARLARPEHRSRLEPALRTITHIDSVAGYNRVRLRNVAICAYRQVMCEWWSENLRSGLCHCDLISAALQ